MEFIAEIGSSWVAGRKSLERAKELIAAASLGGATVVKFQLLRGKLLHRDTGISDALTELQLPEEWLPELKNLAEENGMEFLVTPFFLEAVDLLEHLGVKRYKVASWDITYYPLLERIAETKKPVVLSTGASTDEEILAALEILRPEKDLRDITLLHCTGGYPTPANELNLGRIVGLWGLSWQYSQEKEATIGFSSHTKNPYLAASSVLYGAEVIEAHIDLTDKKGAEAGHSLTPNEFGIMVDYAKLFYEAKGNKKLEMNQSDMFARKNYRRDPSDWLRPVLK